MDIVCGSVLRRFLLTLVELFRKISPKSIAILVGHGTFEKMFVGIDRLMRAGPILNRMLGVELCAKSVFGYADEIDVDALDREEIKVRRRSSKSSHSDAEKEQTIKDRCIYQYFLAMAQDAEDIRLKAVSSLPLSINIPMDETQLRHFVNRLRDENFSIRIEVVKQLRKTKLFLSKMSPQTIYFITETCVHTREAELLTEFVDYVHQQIWSKNEDMDSAISEHIVIFITKFFEIYGFDEFGLETLRYFPRMHHTVMKLLRLVLEKLTTDMTSRVFRHICQAVLKTDLLMKITLIELMILDILIDIAVNKTESPHSEPIQKQIQSSFPEFSVLNGQFIEFTNEHRKDLLKIYYFLKILDYQLNFIENDRPLTLSNLDDLLPKLKTSHISISAAYDAIKEAFPSLRNFLR